MPPPFVEVVMLLLFVAEYCAHTLLVQRILQQKILKQKMHAPMFIAGILRLSIEGRQGLVEKN